jgi:competence protein ComEA
MWNSESEPDRIAMTAGLVTTRQIVLSACMLAALTLAGAVGLKATPGSAPQGAPPTTIDDTRLPPGAGRDVIVRTCSLCHEVYRAASVRLTGDGWAAVVEDMMRRGAKLTEEEAEAAVGYLAANFLGEADRPINLNTAVQIDFESVLGLLRREAAAVIAYREKNGPFKAVADLKKVPGLDYKKIEGKTDRVVVF